VPRIFHWGTILRR